MSISLIKCDHYKVLYYVIIIIIVFEHFYPPWEWSRQYLWILLILFKSVEGFEVKWNCFCIIIVIRVLKISKIIWSTGRVSIVTTVSVVKDLSSPQIKCLYNIVLLYGNIRFPLLAIRTSWIMLRHLKIPPLKLKLWHVIMNN